MKAQIGDMVFIRGSRVLYHTPLIIVDIQNTGYHYPDYIVLDPLTGNRYAYQLHDLTDSPR